MKHKDNYNYNGFCAIDREHWLDFDCTRCPSFKYCKNGQLNRVITIKESGFKVPEAYLKKDPFLRGYV